MHEQVSKVTSSLFLSASWLEFHMHFRPVPHALHGLPIAYSSNLISLIILYEQWKYKAHIPVTSFC